MMCKVRDSKGSACFFPCAESRFKFIDVHIYAGHKDRDTVIWEEELERVIGYMSLKQEGGVLFLGQRAHSRVGEGLGRKAVKR